MSSERESENLKLHKGDVGSVDNRVADSAANPENFQLIEGIIPWNGEHRRMFGKIAHGKFHGATLDNLAILTIHAMPGANILYQTREGLFMNGQ